ncbi:helix-turn-helix domain-containing protein [Halobacteriovorax sp. GB3]|uniref:helix-turn-helix domain-containing protein n=1 Tax=Halobacteriovorax sp. GB3 TaxID=2719615 RepID=UPI0023618C17|nr:helix-turn-helix domain-containing protein [Halobacteriovorax sp. GB3]MDD0851474.1 helix-turn-helix domain-containing protein [Halobacteriovorax sp. GB3]
MESTNKNYYEVLEVPTTATQEEIHQGYMQAKSAYGQDSLALYSLMSKDECEKILGLIEEAYTILSDPAKRSQYNDARGIETVGIEEIRKRELERRENEMREAVERKRETSMTKIVAAKKFSLEYDKNSDFEERIEQANEFPGEFLKEIREYKNVDMNRLAEMTKVSKTYLRNIEEEQFDNLPATVYVRGFVYQYAKCLKLNPELVATSYLYLLKQARGES